MVEMHIPCFDLHKIMASGQIFRMYEPEKGRFTVFSGDRRLMLSQQGDTVAFDCGKKDFEEYWRRYFDLDRDYERLSSIAMESGDGYIMAACAESFGIRILHQDLWEMLISFIISQQKQIPSIRRCIEALSARFGERRCDPSGIWHTFPTPESIASGGPEGLKGLSLGYRERYIYETAVRYLEYGKSSTEVENMELEDALSYFKSFSGVGDKVANCVALFGAGFVDAFPVDTHIKDILLREYCPTEYQKTAQNTGKSVKDRLKPADYENIINTYFSGYAGFRGIVQQWMFAYETGAFSHRKTDHRG